MGIFQDISRCQRIHGYGSRPAFPCCFQSVLGTFNSKEQIDEALSVLEEAPYSEAELKKVQTCLKERIRGTSLKERIDTGKGLRQRPYILREEAADLMEVYPLSV